MKTFDEMVKEANHGDEIRTKLAAMERANKAEQPKELLKVARTLSQENFEAMTPDTLDAVSNMINNAQELSKRANETPGLPGDAAPTEVDTPKEEKPKVEGQGLAEGATDPSIDLDGAAPVTQTPGTSPGDVDIPAELPEAEKTAFVYNSIRNGINTAVKDLTKIAMTKRANRVQRERKVEGAERTIEDLVKTYGEDKVASLVKEAQQRGFLRAKETIYGGENV